MQLFGETIAVGSGFFLLLALLLALSFEFVNGFHDTANAVATVIYTNSLKPVYAVVWSGMWNLIGVLISSGTVAFGILALLPVELVINVGSAAGFAMVFALLISAIIWNVGTWYLGLPASSSHTLIGSIVGVGLANSLLTAGHTFGDGVNWGKVQDTFIALILSPIIGFVFSALLLRIMKALIKNPTLFEPPTDKKTPPIWIRGLLILTCTGVSFAHGSNDGQKGMGLIMLILIGILPGAFALKMNTNPAAIGKLSATAQSVSAMLDKNAPPTAGASPVVPANSSTPSATAAPAAKPGAPAAKLAASASKPALPSIGGAMTDAQASDALNGFLKSSGKASDSTFAALAVKNRAIEALLSGKTSLSALSKSDRSALRSDMYLVGESIGKLDKKKAITDKAEDKALMGYKKQLEAVTKFIPVWVKFAVAIALGLGTMIGWKRIVVTVGEKIGKEHLTYAQGASAELIAMATIEAADIYGLPVSTTHVLSSGVAGTMAANGSGLQAATLRNILLAWVLTLPVCVILGAGTFSAGLYFVFHVLHAH